MASTPKNADASKQKLGTFAGVFTPSILTILGIILFLRMGYVVGAAGIGKALIIILLANAISVLTSISIATIATNLRVKGGGDYYLISRTLGVEFGGALGIVLYLAQSVSIAFYAIGFGEGVAHVLGATSPWAVQIIAAVAVACLLVLAWLGADVATRFQYVVMAVLGSALVAFFIGGVSDWNVAQFGKNWSAASNVPFWLIFAIFFPAVTGFTQGVSMSGDLKDPARSLPLGTFMAVGLSLVVYLLVAIVFAGTVPGAELVSDYGAMRRLSIVSWLVDAGVIAATLSSALASFLGGPRILQSLAADRVFPWLQPFAAGSGPLNNPRRAVLLSALIAFGTIAIGQLNLIAPIVSMFFLVSYGLLNYATYFEARTNSPSFRPSFRFFDRRLSLLGALACLGAMLAIQPAAGAVAAAILFGIYQYLRRSVEVARWSDSSRSHLFQTVRKNLQLLSGAIEHPRDWRPVLLAISDDPGRRERLVRFADWIEGDAGITTSVQVLADEGAIGRKRRLEALSAMAAGLKRNSLDAFPLAVVGKDRGESIHLLLQSFGLGPIRANTVLLNWFDQHPDPDAPPALPGYEQYLRAAIRFGCNLVVFDTTEEEMAAMEASDPDARRIDVWYLDDVNGQLMLLLAHLMTRSPEWREATIRVLVPKPEDGDGDQAEQSVVEMLAEFRIDAEPCIVDALDSEQVVRHSRQATLVFLPFKLKDDRPICVFPGEIGELIRQLPLTALVLAAQKIDLDAAPEEGPHQEIAEAVDAAKAAQDRSELADRESEEAMERVEQLKNRLIEARQQSVNPEELAELEAELKEAEETAEERKRRAAKSSSKAEAAAREAEAKTGKSADDAGADAESE